MSESSKKPLPAVALQACDVSMDPTRSDRNVGPILQIEAVVLFTKIAHRPVEEVWAFCPSLADFILYSWTFGNQDAPEIMQCVWAGYRE